MFISIHIDSHGMVCAKESYAKPYINLQVKWVFQKSLHSDLGKEIKPIFIYSLELRTVLIRSKLGKKGQRERLVTQWLEGIESSSNK